jgi:hypothetical protein
MEFVANPATRAGARYYGNSLSRCLKAEPTPRAVERRCPRKKFAFEVERGHTEVAEKFVSECRGETLSGLHRARERLIKFTQLNRFGQDLGCAAR